VSAYASLLVSYDAAAIDLAAAHSAVAAVVGEADRIAEDETDDGAGRLVEIPTRYGGADGEDLPLVAELTGLSPSQVIELHAGTEYDVFMLGFAPGFAYLGVVPEAIVVPRRPSPRPRVPAGSVAIAGRQTAVYPVESPGGWNLVGRTELVLWDPSREPPALLAPGDRVRFVPIR
jgi:inhibitor of KinA